MGPSHSQEEGIPQRVYTPVEGSLEGQLIILPNTGSYYYYPHFTEKFRES
jgi:hypothetical protein